MRVLEHIGRGGTGRDSSRSVDPRNLTRSEIVRRGVADRAEKSL